jgi:general secretion pathway protein D
LGDIPFFGALFRSDTRSRKKTNLMVFLRPVVIRDANASDRLSADRYEQMRAIQQEAQPLPSTTVPINEAPVLPQMPRRPAPATTPVTEPAPAAATEPKAP